MVKSKFRDPRNDIHNVFDAEGQPHQMTLTNAREMERHGKWTMDPILGAARRATFEDEKVQVLTVVPPAAVTDAPVWEDLSALTKALLFGAAEVLKIEGKIDGRTSEKRLTAMIETDLDKRLAATGDFDGADPVNATDSSEVISAKAAAAIARRRRAFKLAASVLGVEWNEENTLAAFVTEIGTRPEVEPATSTGGDAG